VNPRHLLAVLAALPLASCAYWQRRMIDLHDSFLYRFSSSALGLAVEAKLGPLDAAVGGWYQEHGWGKDTFWQQPGYVLTNFGMGVPITTISPIVYGGPWSDLLATSALGTHPGAPGSFIDARSFLLVSDVFDLDDNYPFQPSPARRIADVFGVEVGAVPLFWNARLGFNVVEFADFLLGFVALDFMGDDGVVRPPTLPTMPAGR
jgi:hypothetical protein